tara:strand:- start:1809 stop:2423 length:615 start_codon:yes stop_codon:yes gene_type:complete
MTSIRAALVRLNVSPQKISFWEVQIERAIQRAQLLDDFDAEQVSEEKQDTKSELSNFERALRAGTRASQLQKRFSKLSKPTIAIINWKLSFTLNDNVGFNDLDLNNDDHRTSLYVAIKSSKGWLNDARGFSHGVKASEIVNAIALIYKQITGKEPGISSTSATSDVNYSTPFEQLLIAALTCTGVTISTQGARALYQRVFLRKK